MGENDDRERTAPETGTPKTGGQAQLDEPQTPRMSRFLRGTSSNVLLRGILIGSGVVLVLFSVFWLGMFVGEKKARFSFVVGQRYESLSGHKQATPPFGRGHIPPRRPFFSGGHAAVGEVISITDDQMVVRGRDNAEKVVLFGDKTRVFEGRSRVEVGEIKDGDRVVVIGRPSDEGQIDARLVRILNGNGSRGHLPGSAHPSFRHGGPTSGTLSL